MEIICVVFLTGLDTPEAEERGLIEGASDYITKPFHPTVVKARVALHLQVVRQRRMLETLANIDGLTELPNRRRFDAAFAAEWTRASRTRLPLSVAILDVGLLQAVQRFLWPRHGGSGAPARGPNPAQARPAPRGPGGAGPAREGR